MFDNKNIHIDNRDRLCQVICTCTDLDSGKERVVYQLLYGDYGFCVEDREAFFKKYRLRLGDEFEADKKAYEKDCSAVNKKSDKEVYKAGALKEEEQLFEPLLEHFLESNSYTEKIKILKDRFAEISQRDLDNIYAALDIAAFEGDIKAQVQGLTRYLSMQEHYVGSRLRG